MCDTNYFTDFESVEVAAEVYDKDPSLIFDSKLHISEGKINTAALEMRSIYTNESYLVDVAAYIKVSIHQNSSKSFFEDLRVVGDE